MMINTGLGLTEMANNSTIYLMIVNIIKQAWQASSQIKSYTQWFDYETNNTSTLDELG